LTKPMSGCVSMRLRAFYGPFGDLKDEAACEAQFRNAFLMGCTGAWSLAPNQIDIARRVFSPDVKEVLFAKRILEAMPDGAGVAMIDGKMQDDATWKQAKVIVDLARLVTKKDPACPGLRLLRMMEAAMNTKTRSGNYSRISDWVRRSSMPRRER
jgi:malyl-CoA/(S)-citramalyl-CoA lyase